jgi:hypothetical protein
MKIPMRFIIEIGLLRKKNKCANCKKKMDVKDYHIQLCKKCRVVELDKYSKEIEEKYKKLKNNGNL